MSMLDSVKSEIREINRDINVMYSQFEKINDVLSKQSEQILQSSKMADKLDLAFKRQKAAASNMQRMFKKNQEEINRHAEVYNKAISRQNRETERSKRTNELAVEALREIRGQKRDFEFFERELKRNTEDVINNLTNTIHKQVFNFENATKQFYNAMHEATPKGQKAISDQMDKEMDSLRNKLEKLRVEKEKEYETLDTRARIMAKTIAQIKKETGSSKLPFFEGLNIYLEKGGTKAEYLAQFLTSTREELKVFGFEVAAVRRFFYGFMPPGTFRLLNKFATTLNFIGGTMRGIREGNKQGNLLMRGLLGGTPDFRLVDKLIKKRDKLKGDLFEANRQLKDIEGQLSNNRTMSPIQRKGLEEQKEYVEGIIKSIKDEDEELLEREKNLQSGIFFDIMSKTGLIGLSETALNISNALDEVEENSGFVIKFVIKLTRFLSKFFIYGTLIVLGLMGLKVIFDRYNKRFKEIVSMFIPFAVEFIQYGMQSMRNALGYAFEFLMAVMSLDIERMLISAGYLLWEVLKVAFIAIGGTVLAGLTLLGAALVAIGEDIWNYLSDNVEEGLSGFATILYDVALVVGGIALTLAGIALFAVNLPNIVLVGIGVIVTAAVVTLGRMLRDKVFGMFGFHADGGIVDTPMQIVGEKGPELVTLPKGSRVSTANDTKKLLSGSNGVVNNITVNLNMKDTSDSEMRRIASKIAKMIGNDINRTIGSSTIR